MKTITEKKTPLQIKELLDAGKSLINPEGYKIWKEGERYVCNFPSTIRYSWDAFEDLVLSSYLVWGIKGEEKPEYSDGPKWISHGIVFPGL